MDSASTTIPSLHPAFCKLPLGLGPGVPTYTYIGLKLHRLLMIHSQPGAAQGGAAETGGGDERT
jgi:hypothetical protein